MLQIIRSKLRLIIYSFIQELNTDCELGWTIYYEAEYNFDPSKFYLSSLFKTIKIKPVIWYTHKIIAKLNITREITSKHDNNDYELFVLKLT